MVRDSRYVSVVRGWVSCVGRSMGRSVGKGIVSMVGVCRVGKSW